MNANHYLKKFDWVLVSSALLLAFIGLVSLYSSSDGDFLNLKKQVVFLGIGVFLMFFLSSFDYRIIREDSYLVIVLYFLCCLLLGGLYFFAPEIRGVRGWYKIGPVSLDPIEFTKVILIILLAKYFSMRHMEMYRFRHIFLSGLYVLLPAVLIFFQPDLGSVIILLTLWVVILLISGIKIKPLLGLFLLGILVVSLGWSFMIQDYQKERLVDFFFPQADPLGGSWSQTQAKIAIGSGGIFGKGFGQGTQTQYGFLPEPHTDFIFSAIAEEFGLVGVFVLFALYFVLITRIIRIAMLSFSNFERLFASGVAALIICQLFINVGMNLSIIPVIGISLPLVSYGGSSLIAFFLILGILLSVQKNTQKVSDKEY